MIYFLTKNTEWYSHFSDAVTVTDDEVLCENVLQGLSFYGYDKEATALNPFYATELLDSIGNINVQVVVDKTTCNPAFIQRLADQNVFYGHNIKYDYTLSKVNGLYLKRVYDLMLAEQRLGLGSGRSNTLNDTYLRRTGKPYPLPKDIRMEFVNWPKGQHFEEYHIVYSATDISVLSEIVPEQERILNDLNRSQIVDIENRLVTILGDMELEGNYLNEPEWQVLIDESLKEKAELEVKMDSILEQMKPIYPILNNFSFKRDFAVQTSLFYEPTNASVKTFNYGSSDQVLSLFESAGLPVPQSFKRDVKLKKKVKKPSISEDSLKEYLIQYPNTPLRTFIEELLKHKKLEKRLNSFGRRFLVTEMKTKSGWKVGYKNPKTKKVHTIYRQCMTATGRLASGDEEIGFYNSQQLPKNNRYRNCFTLSPQEIEEGWKICTMDLSGAEVIIAASLSGETKVVTMKDIHSELATPAYRNVLNYIVNNYPKEQHVTQVKILLSNTKLSCTTEEAEYALENINTYTIDKVDKFRKEIRDDFKRVVYGLFYGGTASRISEVLNVPLVWAEIVEKTLKAELPILFKYLEDNAHTAKTLGYVHFNNRMNTRHIFKSYLEAARYGRGLTRVELGEIERNAKNYPIQGTQADMIKEGMVEVNDWVVANNIVFRWLMQVHDEIVFKFKDNDVPAQVAKILTDTCNRYLINGITMGCDYHVGLAWTK